VFAQLMLAYHNYPEKLQLLSPTLFNTAKGYNDAIISKQRSDYARDRKIQTSTTQEPQRFEGRREYYPNNVKRELPQIHRAPPLEQKGERIGKAVEVTDDEVNALLAILANHPPKETVSDSKVDLSASNLAKNIGCSKDNFKRAFVPEMP